MAGLRINRGRMRRYQRRGALLLVTLLIVSLLGLLGASFAFRMQADFNAVAAQQQLQQARLAAEDGIDKVCLLLRDQRFDVDKWYNNPNALRRQLVWSPDKVGGSESIADQEAVEGRPAWRFSVVAYEMPTQDNDGDTKIRYGVTDEASKININTASRAQLLALFDQLKLEDVTSEQLADALIDWRDQDDIPISSNGAESSYYNTLDPPYKCKNRPLETVEELLMVKGFNGRILYGEDYNRNGYLDPNEDDGPEGLFPPDNGDGILDRGLLPFITVYSWDWNLSNDNRHRVDINTTRFSEVDKLPEYITNEIRQEVIEFIAEAQKRGYRFKSVGDLLGLEVYEDGSSNHDDMWRRYLRELERSNRVIEETQPGEEDEEQDQDGDQDFDSDGRQDDEDQLDDEDDRGGRTGRNARQRGGARDDGRNDTNATRDGSRRGNQDEDDDEDDADDKNSGRRNQSVRDDDTLDVEDDYQQQNETGVGTGRRRGSGRDAGDAGRGGRAGNDGGAQNGDDGQNAGRRGGRGGRQRGTPVVSPVTAQDMVVLVDRLTTRPVPAMAGLINVNTASPIVLRTIPGLSPEQVDQIVAKRAALNGTEKATTAWLLTSGAVDEETFALVCNQLTTRSIQFTVESIGFADHVGAFKRIQAVIEMRGQLAQVKYYRDISMLGIGFPVRDDQRSEGFAFSDR